MAAGDCVLLGSAASTSPRCGRSHSPAMCHLRLHVADLQFALWCRALHCMWQTYSCTAGTFRPSQAMCRQHIAAPWALDLACDVPPAR